MAQKPSSIIEQAAAALRVAGAREVSVFGSAAKGKLRENYDVDMAVSSPSPDVFFRAMGKASRALGRPVDLIELDEENTVLRYLFPRGPDYACPYGPPDTNTSPNL